MYFPSSCLIWRVGFWWKSLGSSNSTSTNKTIASGGSRGSRRMIASFSARERPPGPVVQADDRLLLGHRPPPRPVRDEDRQLQVAEGVPEQPRHRVRDVEPL